MAVRVRAALVLSFMLAGCGGGGGGASPPMSPPPPAAQAPAFSSVSTVSVRENAIDVIYRPVATDPNGDSITYSIGGTDAARFVMNAATREVRFASNPDFEDPADADLNNIYQLTFTASDGGNVATHNVAVTVTNTAPGLRVRKIMPAEGHPFFGYPDGSGRIVQLKQAGVMDLFDPPIGQASVTRIFDESSSLGAQGFLFNTVAFSPNFLTDRTLYIWVTRFTGPGVPGVGQVWKYQMQAGAPDRVDLNSRDVIFSISLPLSSNIGGMLVANSSGQLLLGIGSGDNALLAQDPNSLYGKILRIDPASDAFPSDPDRDYAVPAGNPFAAGGGAPEVFGLGVARPLSGRVDPRDGRLFFEDSGTVQTATGPVMVQEINNGGTTTGARTAPPNYMWPYRVGSVNDLSFPSGGISSASEAEAAYDTALGSNIILGLPYRGPLENYQNRYVFGDATAAKLWLVDTARMTGGGVTGPGFYTEINYSGLVTEPLGDPVRIFSDTRGNLFVQYSLTTPTGSTVSLYIVEPDN